MGHALQWVVRGGFSDFFASFSVKNGLFLCYWWGEKYSTVASNTC